MENKTIYHFLGRDYDNLKDYAAALANNYADGLNFIYQPEFLDQFTDSYLKGRLLAEQKRAYYATSAFAAIIYLLDPSQGLVLSGRNLRTYHDVCDALEDPTCRQACIHLFKDHTISHTLALKDTSLPDIIEIENNIDIPAIVKYFQLYYDTRFKEEDVHGYKKLDFYLILATSDKEPFTKYLELLYSDEFEAILCHHYGIDKILALYKTSNAPYTVLEALKDDISIPLDTIADSGMHCHFFMVNKYYKNFTFKGVTKKLKSKGYKLAKRFGKNASLTFDDNQIYYDFYNFLVRAFDLNLLVPKTNDYALDLEFRKMRVNKEFLDKLAYKDEVKKASNPLLTKKECKDAKKALAADIKAYLKKQYKEYLEKLE